MPKPVVDPVANARMMNEVRWDPHRQWTAEERRDTKAAAKAEIGELSDRGLLLVGVALYWAEGTKDKPTSPRRHDTWNSSTAAPMVIRLYLRWLAMLGVPPENFAFCVAIHESADVAAAERYRRDFVGGESADFTKTTLKRHNPKTARSNIGEAYRGCSAVRVLGSRRWHQRVEGWWAGISGLELSAYPDSGNRTPSRVV